MIIIFHISGLDLKLRVNSNIGFLVAGLYVTKFIEIRSSINSQTERIAVISGVKSTLRAQFSARNMPRSSCPDLDSLQFWNIFIILFTIFAVILLVWLYWPDCMPCPRPPGVLSYARENPCPDKTTNDSAFATPFYRSDVNWSRRRYSHVLGLINTCGFSPT